MPSIDVDQLMQPVSDEQPSGPDLEYDPAFQRMVESSKGKPEQEFGDNVIPAVDPDWKAVRECAKEILARTRDVRPLVCLAAADTALDGISAVGGVMNALRVVLDTHWESVHPELDRDDGDDPTMRFNAMLGLCDPDGMLKAVRDATLVSIRGVGEFSLRHIQVANGQAPHSGADDPPSPALIDGAFLDVPIEELQANADSVTTAIAAIDTMDSELAGRVGVGLTPDLSPLKKQLSEVQVVLGEQLTRRGVGGAPDVGAPSPDLAAGAGVAAQAAPAAPGEIRTREDVLRALDRICDFYHKNEPSSPLPLLLKRAKRLVDKSFVELLQDLAPGGMSEIETIGGLDTEQ